MKFSLMGRLIPFITVVFAFGSYGDKRVDANNYPSDPDAIVEQLQSNREISPENHTASINFDPDLEPGFPIQTYHTGGVYMGGPVINTRVGSIDSDPQLEILVSGKCQGPLYAFNHDGTPVSGWPQYFYNRMFYTTLGNLVLETPSLEVFTGQFIYRIPETPPGPIMAYTGEGSLLPGWPKDSEYDVSGGASLADLDGDGLDEIVVYEGRDKIYAYMADGTLMPGWPINGEDTAHAIADLDRDGDLEIVTINSWTDDGAYLVAYHHDGSSVANFSLLFEPYLHVHPLIGDVDGDQSPEIVIFSHSDGPPYLDILVVSSIGVIERIRPATMLVGCCYLETQYTPALADMDGDGIPEIIIGLGGGIMVWKGNGEPLPGYPVTWGTYYEYGRGHGAPIVGDVDGDQTPDIVIVNQFYQSTTTGEVRVYDNHGNLNPHFPKILEIGLGAVPAIADIDLDGRNELIVTGAYVSEEIGYEGYNDKVWVYDLGGSNYGNIEWGQFGGGPQNWGTYPAPPNYSGPNLYVTAVPSLIELPPNRPIHFALEFGNQGVTIASSVTLTAILDAGLAYIADTSGITPTIDGQTIVWNLPNLGYLIERSFTLDIRTPKDSRNGDLYSVKFLLASAMLEPEFSSKDNESLVDIRMAEQILLPFVVK